MSNAGLPEAGDAVMTFPPEIVADPDRYRAAARCPPTRPEEAVTPPARPRRRGLPADWSAGGGPALRRVLRRARSRSCAPRSAGGGSWGRHRGGRDPAHRDVLDAPRRAATAATCARARCSSRRRARGPAGACAAGCTPTTCGDAELPAYRGRSACCNPARAASSAPAAVPNRDRDQPYSSSTRTTVVQPPPRQYGPPRTPSTSRCHSSGSSCRSSSPASATNTYARRLARPRRAGRTCPPSHGSPAYGSCRAATSWSTVRAAVVQAAPSTSRTSTGRPRRR